MMLLLMRTAMATTMPRTIMTATRMPTTSPTSDFGAGEAVTGSLVVVCGGLVGAFVVVLYVVVVVGGGVGCDVVFVDVDVEVVVVCVDVGVSVVVEDVEGMKLHSPVKVTSSMAIVPTWNYVQTTKTYNHSHLLCPNGSLKYNSVNLSGL